MKSLQLELVTPEGTLVSETVDGVSLPTPEGEITVLPGHEPLVVPIKAGEITVHKKSGQEFVATSGGYVEITASLVRVLADTAEAAADIDEARAKDAVTRAEKFKTQSQDAVAFADAAAALERALARLRVSQRKRRH